jgi:hypothetical protein
VRKEGEGTACRDFPVLPDNDPTAILIARDDWDLPTGDATLFGMLFVQPGNATTRYGIEYGMEFYDSVDSFLRSNLYAFSVIPLPRVCKQING